VRSLPLSIPVRDIVITLLRHCEEHEGLDRDEAYLLARLERGEELALLEEGSLAKIRAQAREEECSS